MGKKKEKPKKEKRPKRRRRVPIAAAETHPGLLESYQADAIALWQDGEYWALDALYVDPNGTPLRF
jgi:hypothetical protein